MRAPRRSPRCLAHGVPYRSHSLHSDRWHGFCSRGRQFCTTGVRLQNANDLTKLALFGVVYGLDWIATMPPTAGLATDLFGTRSGPILFGWVFFGHQVGAALAAYGGGLLRVWLGIYQVAFTTAGLLALGAAMLALTLRQGRSPVPTTALHQPSPAGTPGAVAASGRRPRLHAGGEGRAPSASGWCAMTHQRHAPMSPCTRLARPALHLRDMTGVRHPTRGDG